MSDKQRQLSIALLTLATSIVFVWLIDDAMNFQERYLGGCWPATVVFDDRIIPVADFIRSRVEAVDLGPVSTFFHTRMHHRILLYLLIACAIIGWSGSILLKIVKADEQAEGAPPLPTWEGLFASMVLSGLAAAILFLLLVSTRLLLQEGSTACISQGYAYLAAAGAVGAGLFIVLFYQWFEEVLTIILDKIRGGP